MFRSWLGAVLIGIVFSSKPTVAAPVVTAVTVGPNFYYAPFQILPDGKSSLIGTLNYSSGLPGGLRSLYQIRFSDGAITYPVAINKIDVDLAQMNPQGTFALLVGHNENTLEYSYYLWDVRHQSIESLQQNIGDYNADLISPDGNLLYQFTYPPNGNLAVEYVDLQSGAHHPIYSPPQDGMTWRDGNIAHFMPGTGLFAFSLEQRQSDKLVSTKIIVFDIKRGILLNESINKAVEVQSFNVSPDMRYLYYSLETDGSTYLRDVVKGTDSDIDSVKNASSSGQAGYFLGNFLFYYGWDYGAIYNLESKKLVKSSNWDFGYIQLTPTTLGFYQTLLNADGYFLTGVNYVDITSFKQVAAVNFETLPGVFTMDAMYLPTTRKYVVARENQNGQSDLTVTLWLLDSVTGASTKLLDIEDVQEYDDIPCQYSTDEHILVCRDWDTKNEVGVLKQVVF